MGFKEYEDNTNDGIYSKKLVDAFMDRTWEIKIKREHPNVTHSETWRNMDNVLEFEMVITMRDGDAEFLATHEFIDWETCIEEEIASSIKKAEAEKDMAFASEKDSVRFQLWIAKQFARRVFPEETEGARSEACLCNQIARNIIENSEDKTEVAAMLEKLDCKETYRETQQSWKIGKRIEEYVSDAIKSTRTPSEA